MQAGGGTNIYDALSIALNLTNQDVPVDRLLRPMIIFLTDGQAGGDSSEIIEMFDTRNRGENRAALYTLAFGVDANKDFLKKISLKNSGFMRHIYEAADSSLQLQDFYKSISSLLFTDIEFKYTSTDNDSLTKHNFDSLFGGGELVVSGKMSEKDKTDDFKVHVSALDGELDFSPSVIRLAPEVTEVGELERLWAYMSIKQLLDQAVTDDGDEKSKKAQALNLALKVSNL